MSDDAFIRSVLISFETNHPNLLSENREDFMNAKQFFKQFIFFLPLIFVVSGIVSFLVSLIGHGLGQVDWENSFRLAIIFSIILPFLNLIDSGSKD